MQYVASMLISRPDRLYARGGLDPLGLWMKSHNLRFRCDALAKILHSGIQNECSHASTKEDVAVGQHQQGERINSHTTIKTITAEWKGENADGTEVKLCILAHSLGHMPHAAQHLSNET
jgi:hypothetical protein